MSNTTGATSRAGTIEYPSGAPEFISVFNDVRVAQSLISVDHSKVLTSVFNTVKDGFKNLISNLIRHVELIQNIDLIQRVKSYSLQVYFNHLQYCASLNNIFVINFRYTFFFQQEHILIRGQNAPSIAFIIFLAFLLNKVFVEFSSLVFKQSIDILWVRIVHFFILVSFNAFIFD